MAVVTDTNEWKTLIANLNYGIHENVQEINNKLNNKLPSYLLEEWNDCVVKIGFQCKLVRAKKIKEIQDLSIRETMVYADILRFCPTDYDILRIDNIIKEKQFSGRTIDTLVTKFTKYYNTR